MFVTTNIQEGLIYIASYSGILPTNFRLISVHLSVLVLFCPEFGGPEFVGPEFGGPEFGGPGFDGSNSLSS